MVVNGDDVNDVGDSGGTFDGHIFCSVDGLDCLNVDTRYRLDGLLSKVFQTFFNFFLGKEEGFWLDWVTHNLLRWRFKPRCTQWKVCPVHFHS